MTAIVIKSGEVIADLRSAGWLESEINTGSGLHRRHETADICENDNVDRVWRILGVCAAEVSMALRTFLLSDSSWKDTDNSLLLPEEWTFPFRCDLDVHTMTLLKEKIHQYMVARVMANRLGVLIPEAAKPWTEEAANCLSEIGGIAASTALNHPVRRPLWPI